VPMNTIAFNSYHLEKSRDYSEEDETLSWPIVKGLNSRKELVFKFETSWADTIRFHRATFLTNDIATNSLVKVGSRFDSIISKVQLTSTPNYPDGEILLLDKTNNKLQYRFDVTSYPNIAKGVNSLSEIPSKLKVERIVAFNEN
jgi:hypothetical protein